MGPMAAPAPEMPAQMAMALGRSWAGKTLVRIDRVDGMTKAAATPMTARAAMTMLGGVGDGGHGGADQEEAQAGLQGALAAEAVADGAGGEEQAGEHQGVGVDHPLERAGGGVELPGQRGQGHVQAGVADDDDQQARAQHGEDRPAALVDRRGRSRGRGGGGHGVLLGCARRPASSATPADQNPRRAGDRPSTTDFRCSRA